MRPDSPYKTAQNDRVSMFFSISLHFPVSSPYNLSRGASEENSHLALECKTQFENPSICPHLEALSRVISGLGLGLRFRVNPKLPIALNPDPQTQTRELC